MAAESCGGYSGDGTGGRRQLRANAVVAKAVAAAAVATAAAAVAAAVAAATKWAAAAAVAATAASAATAATTAEVRHSLIHRSNCRNISNNGTVPRHVMRV